MKKYHPHWTAQRLARIAMLAALATVSRLAFIAFPNVKPITAIFLVSTLYLPFFDASLVMAITMLVTGFLLGFGWFVLWQILAYLLLLAIWRFGFYRLSVHSRNPLVWQMLLSAILPFGYGALIALPESMLWHIPFVAYLVGNIPFDTAHALSTALFFPIIYQLFRRFYK